MSALPDPLEYAMRPQSGESLPWMNADGSVREEFEEPFGLELGWGMPWQKAAILAREIWEGELSESEKRLGRLMKRRPSELCNWLFAGSAVAGLVPELAGWRAHARQKQLAMELAKPWMERSVKLANTGNPFLGQNPKRPRASIKSIFWIDSPLGSSQKARLANLLLANMGIELVLLNMLANWAKPAFFAPFFAQHGLELSMGLSALLFAELAVKLKILNGVASIPIWLWARAQLPRAGFFARRRARREAIAHWVAHGADEGIASGLANPLVERPWDRRRHLERALGEARTGVKDGLAAERKEFCLGGDGGDEDLLDESEAGSRRTWPVSLALAQKMAALDRFEKECERVEASASVEGFAQRMADKEHQALQRELGLASLGCEKEAAAMSGRPAAAAAENPDSADRERAKPRRL